MIDLQIQVLGLREIQARLQNFPKKLFDDLVDFISRQTGILQSQVQENISQRFQSQGPLYQSIESKVEAQNPTVTGTVGSYGVEYAALQEYGGKVKLPDVRPINARALLFNRRHFNPVPGVDSLSKFSMISRAHEVTIPEKSYARLALAQQRVGFVDGIRALVAKAEL